MVPQSIRIPSGPPTAVAGAQVTDDIPLDVGLFYTITVTAAAGCTLVSADYSQIELRLLAHMADIESLQQAFNTGVDVHSLTASQARERGARML